MKIVRVFGDYRSWLLILLLLLRTVPCLVVRSLVLVSGLGNIFFYFELVVQLRVVEAIHSR